VRAVSPTVDKDRIMYGDFERIAGVIASQKLSDTLR
jgi:histidine ammonia-lyase